MAYLWIKSQYFGALKGHGLGDIGLEASVMMKLSGD